jgi:hypothetical protein
MAAVRVNAKSHIRNILGPPPAAKKPTHLPDLQNATRFNTIIRPKGDI